MKRLIRRVVKQHLNFIENPHSYNPNIESILVIRESDRQHSLQFMGHDGIFSQKDNNLFAQFKNPTTNGMIVVICANTIDGDEDSFKKDLYAYLQGNHQDDKRGNQDDKRGNQDDKRGNQDDLIILEQFPENIQYN